MRKSEMKIDYTEAVSLAKAGEEQGFGYLYENTYKTKYYLALQYMKNPEAAEDVLQDAYIKAFSKLDTLKDPENFPAWLGQIVANTAKNALVKKNPLLFTDVEEQGELEDLAEKIEDEDATRQPELSYTREETKELVHELIDSLTEEQRMCILLYHIEDLPIKDIAKALGCSENTVKSRLNYGRKNLKIKAEDLQKKGYKLYSLAPLPLLLLLLQTDKEQMLAEGSIQTGGKEVAKLVFSKLEKIGSGTGAANTGSVGNVTGTGAATSTGDAASGASTAGNGFEANLGNAGSAGGAGSTGAAANLAGAGTAAKTGFLATTAGKITVAVVTICVAGGAIFGASQLMGNQPSKDQKTVAEDQDKKTEKKSEPKKDKGEEAKDSKESKDSKETKEETKQGPTTMADGDYQNLIEGSPTKTELEFVLANIPTQYSGETLSDAQYQIIMNDLTQSDPNHNYIGYVGTDANYRYGYDLTTINRFFSIFTDYQFTEDNDSDTDYGLDVQGDVLWHTAATPGYELSASVTEGIYLEDTMEIHYTYVKDSYEDGTTTLTELATLKKGEDGKFKIVSIGEDSGGSLKAQAESSASGNQASASQDSSSGQTSVKDAYQQVLSSIQNNTPGYEFTLANSIDECEYFLYDLNGDGTKELIVGSMFAEGAFYAYDVRVFTFSNGSAQALGGEFATLMFYIPTDGNGLYSLDSVSRGTGVTEISRVTMDQNTLLQGSTEVTFVMGDGADDAFYSANPGVQWKSISDLSGLDE